MSEMNCDARCTQPEDFDPNISKGITDPCVRYCIATHEWVHYTDNRAWNYNWTNANIFKEWPAYDAELKCLQSFGT
jgi:hypothetical protein